jgi:hypothetical protein
MLNRFEYSNDIPPNIRGRLVDREPLCVKAVFESSPLEWTHELDEQKRSLYVLTKHGLVDLQLGAFSEGEILQMTDEAFKNRIFVQDVEEQRKQETAYIEGRLEDWRNRLSRLFTEIAGWIPPPWQPHNGKITQRNEELMQRYNIAPRDIETLTLLNGKHRVAFVPSALWIIGADGRVNVTVDASQYILIDRRSTASDPSQWVIVLGNQRNETVAFTRDVFQALLKGVS